MRHRGTKHLPGVVRRAACAAARKRIPSGHSLAANAAPTVRDDGQPTDNVLGRSHATIGTGRATRRQSSALDDYAQATPRHADRSRMGRRPASRAWSWVRKDETTSQVVGRIGRALCALAAGLLGLWAARRAGIVGAELVAIATCLRALVMWLPVIGARPLAGFAVAVLAPLAFAAAAGTWNLTVLATVAQSTGVSLIAVLAIEIALVGTALVDMIELRLQRR
jgi:hypothetical protein